jgi:[NiFe] hydrogenase assembly HybE family chaperone
VIGPDAGSAHPLSEEPGGSFIARQVAALVQAFAAIHRERMQDMPILNRVLEVEAVGFMPWQGHLLGVLITPWFMNLTLLPGEQDDWSSLRIGQKTLHAFPSGHYEFMVGIAPGSGVYQSRALFSPVFEFADQEGARATAAAVMRALLEPEGLPDGGVRAGGRTMPRPGPHASPQGSGRLASTGADGLKERMNKPLSRRELLRGALRGVRTRDAAERD